MKRFFAVLAIVGVLSVCCVSPSFAQNAMPSMPGLSAFGGLKLDVIQKELKLTDEQKMKLMQLAMASPGSRDAVEKQIAKILNPEQLTRLKQLYLQLDPASAILKSEVAKELELTPEQRAKISAAAKQTKDKVLKEAIRGAKGAKGINKGDVKAKIAEAQEKVKKETLEKVLEILTPQQREQFEKMQGEKIDAGSAKL